jgi:hypothetical protein
MPDHFRTAIEAMKSTADALIAANVGIKQVADAVLLAQGEYIDRGDSIAHLESLVLAMTADLRTMRDEARTMRDEMRDLRTEVRTLRDRLEGPPMP